MRVLQVSAELYPLLKTGGLADVAGALPTALRQQGCDVRVVLPGFPAMLAGVTDRITVATLSPPWPGGAPCTLEYGRLEALDLAVYLVVAPGLYDRPGNPYQDANGQAYGDNLQRFALLSRVAAQLAAGVDSYWQPQLIHAHDWHAGMVPAYLRHNTPWQHGRPVPSVYTIHNLAYQGMFGAWQFRDLGLPDAAFSVQGVEFHGQISFMKAALQYADRITTVSPTYAQEIRGPEQGCGLDGLLRARGSALSGILNGVDEAVWNPATDPLTPAHYDPRDMTGKAACKLALQRAFGLQEQTDKPLFAVVSRLTEQKGLHLVLAAAQEILERGGQLVVLGSGDPWLEQGFRALAEQSAQAVGVRLGYDEALSHRIFAGSDVTLVPSRFEPCGLTQMYGLKYGSLPLVRRVGGLADTVVDSALEELADERATGFVFDGFDEASYRRAVRRAFALYARKPDWNKVRRRGMTQALGWDAAAQQYVTLYRELV